MKKFRTVASVIIMVIAGIVGFFIGAQVAFIAEKKKAYTELQSSALAAAKRGYIDDIIEPDATRKRVIAAFDMLSTKNEERPYKKHGAV